MTTDSSDRPTLEIEITREMIEAGADALRASGFPQDETSYVAVEQILEAMFFHQMPNQVNVLLKLPDLGRNQVSIAQMIHTPSVPASYLVERAAALAADKA